MGNGNITAATAQAASESVLDSGIELIVVALCADYQRRERAVRDRSVSIRTEIEYRYLNYKIHEAACEIVGERLAFSYIKEIGGRIGYAKSEIYYVCESTYKHNKRNVKRQIAKKLHLLD